MGIKRLKGLEGLAKAIEKKIKDIDKPVRTVLGREAGLLQGSIIRKFYSGRSGNEGLNTRTGTARRGWKQEIKESGDMLQAVVYNDVAHADASKEKTIKPKKAKWLTIPVNEALTAAGAPRYTSARDVNGLWFRKKEGDPKTAFLIHKEKGLMFVLKKEVTIPAYTKGLIPFAEKFGVGFAKRVDAAIQKEIDK